MRADAVDLNMKHELLKRDTRIDLADALRAIHELPKPSGWLQRNKKRRFIETIAHLDSLLSNMNVRLVEGHV